MASSTGGFGLAVPTMATFLVPLRAHELDAPIGVIGLIVAASAFLPAMLSVPFGSWIGRVGARRSYVTATTISAGVSLSFLWVETSYWPLLWLQLLLGASNMMGWVASQEYITGIGSGEERARRTGYFALFSNASIVVSILTASVGAELLGVRLAFAVVAMYCSVFVVLGLLMTETDDVAEHKIATRGLGFDAFRVALQTLTFGDIRLALMLTFVRLWVDRLWNAYIPVILVSAGVSPGWAGTVVLTKSLVATIVAPSTGPVARRMSLEGATIVGLSLGLLGIALAPFTMSLPWAYLPAAFVGVSTGLSLPLLLSMIAESTTPQVRPVALGLRTSVNQAASTAAPALAGVAIGAFGFALTFLGASAMAAVPLVIAARVRWRPASASQRGRQGRPTQ